MKRGNLRPVHICLFLCACFALLALLCAILPFAPSLKDALDLKQEQVSDTIVSMDILSVDTVEEEQFDTRIYLNAFYRSLKQTDSIPIRVVHYGDSQIEEDRITMSLRRALQRRYGGKGVGIVPLHQTIPSRTVEQTLLIDGEVQSVSGGPQRYLSYGPHAMHRESKIYGPMGQVAEIEDSATLMLHAAPFDSIRVLTAGELEVSLSNFDSLGSATIHFQGQGDVYGISMESNRGVIVDNIPMRGCMGMVFTTMDSTQLRDYFTATNTRLIILQFGGNLLPGTSNPNCVPQYAKNMQHQIRYLKKLAPESSFLYIGPSDMCERNEGEWQTHHLLPALDKALEQMAIEEEIGYFSMFRQMGGKGSMIRWQEQGLAGGDYIHFTIQGADSAGRMLTEWIF